jgi:hypothetical protein
MIQEFLTSLPNICGSTNGTHIPLANRPSKKVALAQSDFIIEKNSIISIVL